MKLVISSSLLRCSDSHEGIKAAVSKVLSTTWQRCVALKARLRRDGAQRLF